MSVGDLKDYGNKGNNFPWQLKMLKGLQGIINAITLIPLPTTRTPNIINSTTTGTIPTSYGFSVANVGAGAGTVNSESIPAGVTVNFDPGLNNTILGVPFDATGTSFLITYIS
jgi:hypothetical protein